MKRSQPSYLNARDNSIDRTCRPRPNKKINLNDIISEINDSVIMEEEDDDDDIIVQPVKDLDTVSVYLRLRPNLIALQKNPYKIINNTLIVKGIEDAFSVNKDLSEKHFLFSDIYDDKVTQVNIYDHCIRPAFQNISKDQGATFLTYGTSGSGKTYTLLGNDIQPGIVPRAIENIFTMYQNNISLHPSIQLDKNKIIFLNDEQVRKEKGKFQQLLHHLGSNKISYANTRQVIRNDHNFTHSENRDIRVFIWISYVELYNEFVYDLLSPESVFGKREPMKILSNSGDAYIRDLTTVYAESSQDAFNILQYGMKGASYSSTDINRNSSRSHSIFFITVISYSTSSQNINYATYKFCDLAGSERLKKSGNIGDRLKEAQKINTSLMVLGRCLETVHRNQKMKKSHDIVPVRDSKLTMLLQSALLGKESLTMIVNLYPTEEYYEENLNVLNFSSVAKEIHVERRPLKEEPRTTRYSLFLTHATTSSSTNVAEAENIALRRENEELKERLELFDTEVCLYEEKLVEKDEEIQKLRYQMVEQDIETRKEVTDSYETYITIKEEKTKERIQQVREITLKECGYQIEHLKTKIQRLNDCLDDAEDNEALSKIEINSLKEELEKYQNKEREKRRLSV